MNTIILPVNFIFIAIGGGLGYITGYIIKKQLITQEINNTIRFVNKKKHYEILFTYIGVLIGSLLYSAYCFFI